MLKLPVMQDPGCTMGICSTAAHVAESFKKCSDKSIGAVLQHNLSQQ